MLITDLKSPVIKFLEDEMKIDSVLIDGKWGIGKTHTLCNILEEAKIDYFYLSLFGIDSLKSLMVRLSEKLDTNDIFLADDNIVFVNYFKKRNYLKSVIVFDDLERIAGGIDYLSVFSVMDSLIKLGFKIICVVNSESINRNAQASYRKFLEKTFDKIYYVEPDYSLFNEIVKLEKFNFSESVLKDVNLNWRAAKKAATLYLEVCKYLTENGDNSYLKRMNLDDLSLFRCCLIAVNCFYGSSDESPEFKGNEYERFEYDEDFKEFGREVADCFYRTFSIQKENSKLKTVSRLLILCLQKCDYKDLYDSYYSVRGMNDIVETYPFNKEYYYYDDLGKEEFRKRFFTNINSFNFGDKRHVTVLSSIINYSINDLTNDEINLIINRMKETIDPKNLYDIFFYFRNEKQSDNLKIQMFKKRVDDAFKQKIKQTETEQLESAACIRDYEFLANYLYKYKTHTTDEKQRVLEHFLSNDYFFPDLSLEIDYEKWHYCHELANFVADTNEENIIKFVAFLRRLCSNSNSKVLKDRCWALVYSNIKNKEFLRYFE